MSKYKINFIFNSEKDLNAILVNILNKELKSYILEIDKNKKIGIVSSLTYLSLEDGKNC